MSAAHFYIISSSNFTDCLKTICRITEKAWQNNHQVHVETPNQAITTTLNDMLWTFRDSSFIPHNSAEEPLNSPILISHNTTSTTIDDILINLTNTIPPFYSQFNRIIELVYQNDDIKKISREHFKYYKKNGFTLESYKL